MLIYLNPAINFCRLQSSHPGAPLLNGDDSLIIDETCILFHFAAEAISFVVLWTCHVLEHFKQLDRVFGKHGHSL